MISTVLGIGALTGLYIVFEHVEEKAHNIFQRSSYSFGGAQGQASHYWQQIPSWDEVKNYASNTQVLPEPTMWEHAKSLVTRKPVRQIQAESAYASGKQTAEEYAKSGQAAFEQSKTAASDAAAAAQDAAKRGADATKSNHDAAKSAAANFPERVRSSLFGLKTAAEKEASRQRRVRQEAQWRSEFGSKQSLLSKLQHIIFGPAKLPSEQHFSDAAAAGSSAYDHSANAASEAYKAAKDAAEGVVAGTRGAARTASGAAASVSDAGGRAAGSIADTASSAYHSDAAATASAKAAAAAAAAKKHGSAAYNAAQDAAQNVRNEL